MYDDGGGLYLFSYPWNPHELGSSAEEHSLVGSWLSVKSSCHCLLRVYSLTLLLGLPFNHSGGWWQEIKGGSRARPVTKQNKTLLCRAKLVSKISIQSGEGWREESDYNDLLRGLYWILKQLQNCQSSYLEEISRAVSLNSPVLPVWRPPCLAQGQDY